MPSTEVIDLEALAREIEARIRALPRQTTATVRATRREFSKRLASASSKVIIKLALRLLNQHRFVAYELVCHHREAFRSLQQQELKQLGRGLASWGDVDSFACYLAGPAWRQQQIPDRLIHQWVRSKDHWWRRVALVSTVPLNNKTRGGNGDAARALQVCQMLVHDRDDMVVKALSWALRELAKRDPKAVRQFLAENKDLMAARVRREVRNKLTTGLKNPRGK